MMPPDVFMPDPNDLNARMRLFTEAVEHDSQAFVAALPGGALTAFNSAFCELVGYAPSELEKAVEARELTPPEWQEADQAAMAELLRSGTPQRYQKEYLHKNGTRVPVEVTMHRVLDENGEVSFYFGYARDISERLTEHRRAQEHARRMSFLHEISAAAISSLDAHDVARRIAEVAGERAGALFVAIRLANRERSRLHLVASRGLPDGYLEQAAVIPAEEAHIVPHVFGTGNPAYGASGGGHPLGRPLSEQLAQWGVEPGSFLVLPLRGRSSTVGVITLGWEEPQELAPDDIDFYASISNILAVGIENAYLFEDEREAAEAANRLSAAASLLAAEFGGIFESLTDALVVLDAEARVARTNGAASALFGFDPLGMACTELAERAALCDRDGEPLRRDQGPWQEGLRGETVRGARLILTAGEREVRVLVSASPLVSGGVVTGTVLVWRDVTEREQLLETLARERRRAEDILTSITDGFAVLDERGVYRYANHSLATMVDKRVEDIVGRHVWDVFPEAVGTEFDHALETVRSQGAPVSFQQYYEPSDLWTEARIYPTTDGVSIFATDISSRRKADQERERLLAAYELELVRTSLLKDTAAAAAGSLAAEEICRLVLTTTCDRLGTLRGALHLLDDVGGVLNLAAVDGYSEAESSSVRRLEPGHSSPQGHLVSATLDIVTHDTDIPRAHRDEEAGAADERWLVLPVSFAGRTLGTLSLYFAQRRPFTEDEVSLFRSIAGQLGIALDNARLYQREHRIADTLQQSLLADPTTIDGLEVGRVYRSATEHVRVGGDFYDVYELPNGRVGVSIGDVSGKGLAAAALTALVRNTLRAYALEDLAPDEVMSRSNEVLRHFSDSEMFATAVYGTLDLAGGVFEYCNGGHPAPYVLSREGSVTSLDTSGPMLGAFGGLTYRTRQVTLAEEDVLVFYTDGVIEARRDGSFFGEERLVKLLGTLAGHSAERIAGAVAEAAWEFGGGMLRDDVAVLAIGAPRTPAPR